MTTTERALATPSFSEKQLKTRIELAQRSFGLQQANQTQLNIVYLLCQRWDLDPLTDITLFEGRPWVTIDGRVKLMRRHPEYRGYSCRPLSRNEKEAWGYDADDIVVECTVRTTTWGEISARGKVAAAEVQAARNRAAETGKRSAPIGMHPVEIAEKRAIARAERAAFGQDTVLDEEEVVTILEERNAPEKIARDAAMYDRIYGSDAEPGSAFADMPRNHATAALLGQRRNVDDPSGSRDREDIESASVSDRGHIRRAVETETSGLHLNPDVQSVSENIEVERARRAQRTEDMITPAHEIDRNEQLRQGSGGRGREAESTGGARHGMPDLVGNIPASGTAETLSFARSGIRPELTPAPRTIHDERLSATQSGPVDEDGAPDGQEAEGTRSALVASYRALLADAARKLGPAFSESEWVLAEDASDDEIEARGVELSAFLTSGGPKGTKLLEEALKKNAALLADAEQVGVRGLRLLKAASSDSLDILIKKNREIGARLRSRAGETESDDPQQGAF
jgi:RecT family